MHPAKVNFLQGKLVSNRKIDYQSYATWTVAESIAVVTR